MVTVIQFAYTCQRSDLDIDGTISKIEPTQLFSYNTMNFMFLDDYFLLFEILSCSQDGMYAMHIHTHTHTCMHARTHGRTHTYTQARRQAHTHTHKPPPHTHIHTHKERVSDTSQRHKYKLRKNII